MNYFILGSCVTRDIFRVVDKENVVDYYARTTLKSLISKPLNIFNINLESEFQKKIVMRDFEKTFFDDLKNAEFDFLIIDLIDERFDIIKANDSFVTRSVEFVNAGLDKVGNKIIKSLDDWKVDCEKFAKQLLDTVALEKIIIHEAYWAKQYVDGEELKEYPNQENIDKNNFILKEYYSILKNHIPVKTVKVDNIIGDAKHIWGLTPFHYKEDYYKEIYYQLRT